MNPIESLLQTLGDLHYVTSEDQDVIQVGQAGFPCYSLKSGFYQEREGRGSNAETKQEELGFVQLAQAGVKSGLMLVILQHGDLPINGLELQNAEPL